MRGLVVAASRLVEVVKSVSPLPRWIVAVGVLAVALASPSGALAAPAAQDSVAGTGSTDFFTGIDFSVTSGPFGENPTGHLSFTTAVFGSFEADTITCLEVDGKAATIGATLKPNAAGFTALVVTVTDNGPAGSGLDAFSASPSSSAPTTCPFPIASPVGNLPTGDIVVVDAARRRGLGCGDANHTHTEASGCGGQPAFAGLKEDSVTGEGDFSNFFFTDLDLDVSSGPQGENPTGHIAVTVPPFGHFETASITCFAVSGNAVTIGATLKDNSAGFVAVVAHATDNSTTGLEDAFDAGPVATAPTVCPVPVPSAGFSSNGNIVVRDAGGRRGLGCSDPNHTHADSSECR
jgi:hypothetical protein